MLVQGGCTDLAQSNGIPLSFQDVLHFIIRSVFIIESQIAGKILRDHPVLNVLADHLTVYGFSKDLINLDQTRKILPASGCGKDLSVYGILHPVEIFFCEAPDRRSPPDEFPADRRIPSIHQSLPPHRSS